MRNPENALPSATMALEALREQCETVWDLEEKLKRERALRDDLIRDARKAKIPYSFLGSITKLTRDRLSDIISSKR